MSRSGREYDMQEGPTWCVGPSAFMEIGAMPHISHGINITGQRSVAIQSTFFVCTSRIPVC